MTSRRILNVLIACEESQAECEAFRALGHRAFSCDIKECRKGGNPEWHIHGDVTPYLAGMTRFRTQDGRKHFLKRWDLVVAHPPCTYLCKMSSVQMHKNPDFHISFKGKTIEVNYERLMGMKRGREFFMRCLNAQAPYVAVENPVPMAIARLPKPNAFACPSWYGVKYAKKTCYWLKNLPPLMAGIEYPNPKCFVRCSRGKYRSRTFKAMAKALAFQWSDYILKNS